MKRSEMVQEVLDCTCGTWELNKDRVEAILAIIEKAGMRITKEDGFKDERWLRVADWEDEDEH